MCFSLTNYRFALLCLDSGSALGNRLYIVLLLTFESSCLPDSQVFFPVVLFRFDSRGIAAAVVIYKQ